MGRRTIFAVGLDLPNVDGFDCIPIRSDMSLLDAGIIVFRPIFESFRWYSTEEYQGRTLLSQTSSFELKEKIDHWRNQIAAAFESGKTIVVFLPAKQEVFRHTGEEIISGTGHSMVRRHNVVLVNNYEFLPLKFDELVPGRGRAMKLAPDSEILAAYWQNFCSNSIYEVHFKLKSRPLVLTKLGDKMVGAMVSGKGKVVCLPDIEWDAADFITEDGEERTKAAETFTFRLRDEILSVDAALRVRAEGTPEPDWAREDKFRLAVEAQVENQILDLGTKIESLVKERAGKRVTLKEHASLRALLYEKGRPLEAAVREALATLGFEVSQFKQKDSEFDAVFSSSEGRFIGEVEGKDTRAINVDKYSQLERNVNEDLSRDEIAKPAKGVLFGNAERLTAPGERGEFFTQKVLTAARRTGTVLIRTPDLFAVVRYLKDNPNESFAEECRKAIAWTDGAVVLFPDLPEPGKAKVPGTNADNTKALASEEPNARRAGNQV
jgi:hypothetical protein